MSAAGASPRPLVPAIAAYVAATLAELDQIPVERRQRIAALASFVRDRTDSGEEVALTFICTHNSRRSHMSQVWAETAAHCFGIDGVTSYSGGTEATAFSPRAVAALARAGFHIEQMSEGDNPVYAVRFVDGMEPLRCFSKVYNQPPNPDHGFAAVMTCSDADAACPIVFGAAERVSIPYEDPKAADGTDGEASAYDERCRQIAREMLYLFSAIEAA
jgi:arsenate reductase